MKFLTFIGALTIAICSTLLGGLVVFKLWGWFIVPLGVVKITIPQAIGISLFCTMINGTRSTGYYVLKLYDKFIKDEVIDKSALLVDQSIFAIGLPVAVLLGGYIVHLFM